MNRNQAIAIGIAFAAACLAFAVPSYYDNGGLIGGTVYFPFRKPPAEFYISLNERLLDWELAFVALSLCAALIAFRFGFRRRQKTGFLVGFAIEMIFLAGSLPGFSTALYPEFTWLVLNVSGIILLGLVFRFGRDRQVIDMMGL